MYKILIADDEQIIRDGMKKLIDWESLGLQLVGVAENGEEAYQMIKKFNPDIAMVDINMPQIDGLKLCKMIKEEEINCEVIIVTGYDEFNYAREALRLEVNDYILKPLTRIEITEILKNVVVKLDKKQKKLNEINDLNNKVKESISTMQSKYLNALMYGDINSELFHLDSHYDWYLISILDIDTILSQLGKFKEEEIKLTKFAIYNIANEILNVKNSGIIFNTDENESAILFFSNGENSEIIVNDFIGILEEIRSACSNYLKITVTVGVGTLVNDSRIISKSYYNARKAMEYRFFIGNGVIVYANEFNYEFKEFKGGLVEIQSSIIKNVKGLNSNEVRRELDHFSKYMKLEKLDKNLCINEWIKLVIIMFQALVDMDVDIEKILSGTINVTNKVNSFKNIEEIKIWVLELYEKCSEYIETYYDANKKYFFNIKFYMKENFTNQDFSFQRLCDYMHLSPSYLSSIFKNHIGKTFIEYLTELRMQKALELLTKTSLKSFEIAYQVGYSDPHYFSSVFKRTFNESPTEYRNGIVNK